MNLDEKVATEKIDKNLLEEEDKWIISRINTVIREVTTNLEKYELGIAAQNIYDFIWDEYCDWYIEMVKLGYMVTIQKAKKLLKKCYYMYLKEYLNCYIHLCHSLQKRFGAIYLIGRNLL